MSIQPVSSQLLPQQQPIALQAKAPSAIASAPLTASPQVFQQPAANLAQGFPLQNNASLLTMMMQMMQKMLQLLTLMQGGQQPQQSLAQPALPATGNAGTSAPVAVPQPVQPTTGNAGTSAPVAVAQPAQPITGNAGTAAPVPTQPASGNAGTAAAGSAAQPTGNSQLEFNDLLNYVLAGSQGGTANPDGKISDQFAQSGSRFATAGANEFDAAVAKAYVNQFKGNALGLDVVYTPGQDTPETIANNLLTAQNTKMNPEAELLANVAATYRGDFGGQAAYDNAALGRVLQKWGRSDIASQPGVGQTDIESIGGVVKALNEQPDASIRQTWMQDIFDFQNNSPTSPSGAVPDTANYQKAINIVRNGTLDKLVDNYKNGIKTSGPLDASAPASGSGSVGSSAPVSSGSAGSAYGSPGTGSAGSAGISTPTTGSSGNAGSSTPATGSAGSATPSTGTGSSGNAGSATPSTGTGSSGNAGSSTPSAGAGSDYGYGTPGTGTPGTGTPGGDISTPDINKNIDFTKLSKNERTALGLNDRDRAILHLWGRQVISTGRNNGDIYNNVSEPGSGFTDAEKALVQEMTAKEKAEFGGITGKELDREFFSLMQRIDPSATPQFAQQYLNAPVQRSTGNKIDIVSDVSTLQQRTGLNDFEQAALRLWGHEPLFNGGKIDGSILAYTAGNSNALDSVNKGGPGAGIDPAAQALLETDLATDGVRNGDTLKSSFKNVLDKIYLGGAGTSLNKLKQDAQAAATAAGRSAQQVATDVKNGVKQAMDDVSTFVKDHPSASIAAAGGLAAATAVCPFLGGLGTAAAGVAAGKKIIENAQKNQAGAY